MIPKKWIIQIEERLHSLFFHNPGEGRAWHSNVLRILFVLLIHTFFSYFLLYIGHLPYSIYEGPVITIGFLQQLVSFKFGFPVLLFVLFLVTYRNRLQFKWKDLERGKELRIIAFVLALILTWKYAFYDFNLYFFQGYYLERVVLIIFAISILLRPVGILPFLWMLTLIIRQFKILAGFSWAVSSLPFGILTLMLAFAFFFGLCRKFILKDFIFLLICLAASHYWLPGFGKIDLTWIMEDRLAYLIPSSYANGWIGFLSQSDINSFMEVMDALNIPLKIMVLILELGAMFVLIHKKVIPLFIMGWVGMHIGIFFNTGIFFWVWSLTDLTILYFFIKKDNLLSAITFVRLDVVLGIVLIMGGSYWNRVVKLAWYDTPLTYVYQYEAINEDGKIIQLPHHFFAPYDYQFAINSLSYLCDWPLLNTSETPDVMKRLVQIESKEEFLEYENQKGVIQYNAAKSEQFREFLSRYISNWNRRQSNRSVFSILEAPRLLWTYPLEFETEDIGKISSIEVKQVTSFYLHNQCEEFRERIVMNIPIPKTEEY